MSKKIKIESEIESFFVRAVGVMLDGKNRVLLCRLEDDDLWVLPGGQVYLHETLQEGVKRELFEETNFEIKVQRLLWILENFFIFNGKKFHSIEFYFLVTPAKATGVWEQDEFLGQEEQHSTDRSWVLDFKWFDISKLNEVNFKPTTFIELLKDIPKHPTHVVWDTYGRKNKS
ncbi:MAG: NUDIX hydrolase [Candidatus Hermodarchaeota archaeon]